MSAQPIALITGGAGFIGSHLTESLLDRGYQVTIVDDLSTGAFENISRLVDDDRVRFVNDSIINEVVMDRLISECTIIFHLAAAVGVHLIVKDPVHAIETNIVGTQCVIKIANRYGRKVLLASTSEIYGKSVQVPFREDDDRLLGATSKSRWSYSTSKAVDEILALAYHKQMGLPVVICRVFNTVGFRQTGEYGMVVPRFVEQGLRGEPLTIFGDGQQSRCFCDVADTVRAMIGLAESPDAVGQVFNIGSVHEVTVLELAHRVLAAVDRVNGTGGDNDDRLVFVPYDQAYEAGFEDMRRRVPDISKIREAIGWEPTIPLDETLQKIVDGLAAKTGKSSAED